MVKKNTFCSEEIDPEIAKEISNLCVEVDSLILNTIHGKKYQEAYTIGLNCHCLTMVNFLRNFVDIDSPKGKVEMLELINDLKDHMIYICFHEKDKETKH